MSSRFLTSNYSSLNSKMQRFLTTTTGLGRLFNHQSRTYKVTTIPAYDMTQKKFSGLKGDRLGCNMPALEFEEYYKSICKELDMTPEQDNLTSKRIEEAGGEIDDIIDINEQVKRPTIKYPVISPIENVGGQSPDAPTSITWPPEFSDPFGFVGGIIRNILTYSLESEVYRNLDFMKSLKNLVADEAGEFSSVLQYYVGFGAGIKFNDLNFLLKFKGQSPLNAEQLATKDVVEKNVSDYMDTILPAPIRKFKIDMTSKEVKILHVQSPHSSAVVKFKLLTGEDGYFGAEIGLPTHLYVDNKLVKIPTEQVTNPAVFQSMNRPKIVFPETLEELDKMEPGVTPDNFYKFDTKLPIEELPVEKQPVIQAINLMNFTKDGKDNYLSDGTPGAIVSHKIPNAKLLALILYFATGRKPHHGLRLGGYFAHIALLGQARACEILLALGCDIGGIKQKDLLRVLSDLKQYDLSQEMRESIYENFLYIELSLDGPDKLETNIFSLSSAKNYLTMTANSFAVMKITKELLFAAEQRINDARVLNRLDPEAQEIYDRLEKETRSFMHRYEHLWAIADYIVLNMHRTLGLESLLDSVDENQTVQQAFNEKQQKTSAYLTMALAMTNEKIETLKKLIADDTRTQNVEVKSVQQNSLDLAQKALKQLDSIENEMNQ
ncbi:MAG: hypothetical protein V7723_16435 [Sneathiella sp.]|uniref:hypothetical protein n=1 Tax=Sneathiella sp. TaxID=1964365 RepID=UPI00300318B8